MTTLDLSTARVESVTEDGRVLWRVAGSLDLLELTPAQMQANGLVDVAGTAISDYIDRQAEPVVAQGYQREAAPAPTEATNGVPKPEARPAGPEVVAGEGGGWRWQKAGDEWAIDNKPVVQAHDPLDGRCPEYQHIVLPDEIVRAIVGL